MIEGIRDSETVEAITCREGLALASNLTLNRVWLPCDNSRVVRSSKEEGFWILGQIIQEIDAKACLPESFVLVHENRASNVDTHSLARSSIFFELSRKFGCSTAGRRL